MDDILSYLSNYALDHNIGVILTRCLPSTTSSAASKSRRMVVVNMNWKNQNEIPFMFGHELGHVEGDVVYYYHSGTCSPRSSEQAADLFSINLLYQYATSRQQSFATAYQFMTGYGIPGRCLDCVERLLGTKNELIY